MHTLIKKEADYIVGGTCDCYCAFLSSVYERANGYPTERAETIGRLIDEIVCQDYCVVVYERRFIRSRCINRT